MGVEYRHLLIPRDNTLRPSASQVSALIEAWREHRFLPSGAVSLITPHNTSDHAILDIGALREPELIVRWREEDTRQSMGRHPLGFADGEDGQYFDIELHFAEDFVCQANEQIDPPDAICACGEELEFWPEADIFYASRIHRQCPACGEAYRPQDKTTAYRDGETGAESEVVGGAVYRFAIVIDCGKSMPSDEQGGYFATDDFVSVSSAALEAPLYEIGYYY